MAEEYYSLPEAPVYNAGEIRKIQDSDPVRASTVVNPVVEQLIENTHAVKLKADDNTAAIAGALEVAAEANKKAERALQTAQRAAQDAADAEQSAGKALVAADAALAAITKLANTIDAIPSQNGSLTYTGSAQTPSWNSFNPDALEIGGATSGTNAGTYTATFTPKGNYTWGDGTNDARSATWTIRRAAISAAPAQSGSLTYTGNTQAPSWSNYNTAQLTIGGTTSAANAGTYSATFTPTANYRWSDGSTAPRSISWTIRRAAITVTPAQSGSLAYTGSTRTPSWSSYNTAQLTIGGTTSATNAGTYSATFTPTANYQWADGKTTAKSVNWIIGKAAGSLSLNKTSMTLNGSAKSSTIVVTRAGDGAVSAASSNTSVATVSVSGTTVTVSGKAYGTATITVKVAAGTNHAAPANKTCSVTVNLFNATLSSNSWAMIKAASDAGEGANFWSIGDTKRITINGKVGETTFSNLAIDVFIIGFNHNSSREGNNRIHFQLGKIGGKDVCFRDNNYSYTFGTEGHFIMIPNGSTSDGGWNGSYMRKTMLGNSGTPTNPVGGSLMAALPSDLRAVMKSVTKYSDNTGGGTDTASHVTATTDYLFLLAEFEYYGARSYANSAEKNFQLQYAYYKAGNSKIKYWHENTEVATHHWTRSTGCNNNRAFCIVNVSNTPGTTSGSQSRGISPGFAV